MNVHKRQMAKTVRVLSYLLKSAGVDPDKSLDMYFTCSPGKLTAEKSSDLERFVNESRFSARRCDMATSFDDVISQVLRGTKPTSIYVLTNGRWKDDRRDSLCGVDDVIERTITGIKNNTKQRNWIGVQFLRFHNPGDENDRIGQFRLKTMDDDLKRRFGSDIVDTRDWNEDVCSMLLGGVFPDIDEDN